MTTITMQDLKAKYDLSKKDYEHVLNAISNEIEINHFVEIVAAKYKTLEEFKLDGDYEKTFTSAFNGMNPVSYVIASEITLSKSGIALIKKILHKKEENSGRKSIIFIHDTKRDLIHFTSDIGGIKSSHDLWLACFPSSTLFQNIEKILVNTKAAHNCSSLIELRKCGDSVDYEMYFNLPIKEDLNVESLDYSNGETNE